MNPNAGIRKKLVLWTLCLCLALCAALAAAEPLSLDRCVDMAADHSWTMREAAVSLRQAKSDLDVARAARGLSVSANAGHNVSQRPFVRKDVGQNSSVGLSASLPLYSGGSVSANVERSEAKLLQQEAGFIAHVFLYQPEEIFQIKNCLGLA